MPEKGSKNYLLNYFFLRFFENSSGAALLRNLPKISKTWIKSLYLQAVVRRREPLAGMNLIKAGAGRRGMSAFGKIFGVLTKRGMYYHEGVVSFIHI